MLRRFFVEKKTQFNLESENIKNDLISSLGISSISGLRIFNTYMVDNISADDLLNLLPQVFYQKNTDDIFFDNIDYEDEFFFIISYLESQYDQRADSAETCIRLIDPTLDPKVRTGRAFLISGDLSLEDKKLIQEYLVNPVDSRIIPNEIPTILTKVKKKKIEIKIHHNFMYLTSDELSKFIFDNSLSMSFEDLVCVQSYFRDNEKRNPTETEIKVLDTYWSDHCRHTTFLTEIKDIEFKNSTYGKMVKSAFDKYLEMRKFVDDKMPISLMNIACMGARYNIKKGILTDEEKSDEINACSVKVKINVDGKDEDWLLMFKNETHNHPTEIEPFGGAATCLGGAIRDPLSGRSYVYQAMRVTGSASPLESISETIDGKLPQKKITKEACLGYSSYGNQIGIATGQVKEFYHPGYKAKRMEVGAVIAAAPASNVRREKPLEGDVIILVGGRTGRDGCGGATGSSKVHTESSLVLSSAEVQKGNPLTERKLQTLFKKVEVTKLIKKCNDFGAGGISVAIGELADGVEIDLNAVKLKDDSLSCTEIAISESQERMAVVVSASDAAEFIRLSNSEGLESTIVAKVTSGRRVKMLYDTEEVVNISRDFLDSNGANEKVNIEVTDSNVKYNKFSNFCDALEDLTLASQDELVEYFDSTIGASSVLMPLGGKYQKSFQMGMVSKLPVNNLKTDDVSIMSFGFDPYVSSSNEYIGGMYSVLQSVSKVICLGGKLENIHLSLQEYFPSLNNDPKLWGKPFASLLGALTVQRELGISAIGGKDSMSGTFNDLSVPPTLISFAVSMGKASNTISSEFKNINSNIYMLKNVILENGSFDFKKYISDMNKYTELVANKKIKSASAVLRGGIFSSICNMALGNRVGVDIINLDEKDLLKDISPSIIFEVDGEIDAFSNAIHIGKTKLEPVITVLSRDYSIDEIECLSFKKLEGIFKNKSADVENKLELNLFNKESSFKFSTSIAKPKVLIPIFSGTNCEIDTKRVFDIAGGDSMFCHINSLSSFHLMESIRKFGKLIVDSNIVFIPGGFSGGDEPDGSAKFITAVFKNPLIRESITDFLKRGGLMGGICNGYQALIKLGLLPYGEYRDIKENSPTLTNNLHLGHISKMVRTKIVSNISPWTTRLELGREYILPISHGEGRFIVEEQEFKNLQARGQIISQYVDFEGKPSMEKAFNPNGSYMAVEGISSPDGRIFGKMGHSERYGENIYKNIPNIEFQDIFGSSIDYFK